MANHISDILSIWFPLKDEQDWVLASIIETEGSSYRKAGAIMLINDLGQYFGLLSGGCLESDIMRHARYCMQSGSDKIIEYDMRDDADLAWQLGLGCGGRVKILLQPVGQNNQYLNLPVLLDALKSGQEKYYAHDLSGASQNYVVSSSTELVDPTAYFLSFHQPQVALAVFGGGVDARPLVALAVNMGWEVYLIDHRSAYAREPYFPGCKAIIRQPCDEIRHVLVQEPAHKNGHNNEQVNEQETLRGKEQSTVKQSSQQAGHEEKMNDMAWLQRFNAAVVMTHNVEQDAAALAVIEKSAAKYVGLLGPTHRTERVFDVLKMAVSDYQKPLWNPMGLALGGELPESIALSVISEIHQTLFSGAGGSISLPQSMTNQAE